MNERLAEKIAAALLDLLKNRQDEDTVNACLAGVVPDGTFTSFRAGTIRILNEDGEETAQFKIENVQIS